MKRHVVQELGILTNSIENLSKDIINSCYRSDNSISTLGLMQAKIKSQILVKKLQELQKLSTYINRLKSID
jgi:hypothetical protein